MEQIARFKPGANVPALTSAAVTAGRFVAVSGTKAANGSYSIAHAGTGARAIGVAERSTMGPVDANGVAVGINDQRRHTNVVRSGAIARVTAGGAIAAGDLVMSDATGRAVVYTPPTIDPTATTPQAVPAEPVALAEAMHAVAAAGDIVEVALF